MMKTLIKWAPETNPAPRLKYQNKLKQQWILDSTNSNLKQSVPLTWNYQLSIKIKPLLPMTEFLLISSNGHFSSHLKKFQTHHNSPKIYIAWPSKATPFFILKNGGMPSFMPSENIYQKTRTNQHKNISNQKITTYIPLSSQHAHIS